MPLPLPVGRLLSLAPLIIGAALCAAEKLDLNRVTPVPATEPIPVQDFIRPALMESPQINRAGTHIAARISSGRDLSQLLVSDLRTQQIESVGDVNNGIGNFWWLTDNRILFHKGHLMAANVGNLKRAYPLLTYCTTYVVSIPEANRALPQVWIRWDPFGSMMDDSGVAVLDSGVEFNRTRVGSLGGSDLEREGNNQHIVKRFPMPKEGLAYGYMADKDGETSYMWALKDGVPSMFRLVGDAWEKCPIDVETVDIFCPGNKAGEVVALVPTQPGMPRALRFMDAATGALGDVLIQDKNYDFSGNVYRDPATREIVGASFFKEASKPVWFSETYEALQKKIDAMFPGQRVYLTNSDLERKRFVVAAYSDRQPHIFYLVDLEKNTVGLIKQSAPWIDPARMRPMHAMKFKTRDGLRLDAYVTLPAGASKQNPPPLVVLPHDGPWLRNLWGYDCEAQLLASRGYAVLQPNYRGSEGYSWMYPLDDQWAFRKMCDDVTDATKTLVAAGLVDGNRIAIMGTGFGGYLAVAGAAFEPSLYRCAVAIEGIFDWEKYIKNLKYYKYETPSFGRLVLKLGDPKRDKGKLEEMSPVRHADKIKAPIFLTQAKDNSGLSLVQTSQLVSELERFHVPYEMMMIPREAKDIDVLAHRIERYERIEAFLAKHMATK